MQRRGSAGNDSLHKICRRAEGGRDFARIQNADAPAASGADVKQPTTVSQRFSNHFNCTNKIRRGSTQCFLNKFLLFDKDMNQFVRTHFFKIFRARIALLRQRNGQTVDFSL